MLDEVEIEEVVPEEELEGDVNVVTSDDNVWLETDSLCVL